MSGVRGVSPLFTVAMKDPSPTISPAVLSMIGTMVTACRVAVIPIMVAVVVRSGFFIVSVFGVGFLGWWSGWKSQSISGC
jgi:hypothetical protein